MFMIILFHLNNEYFKLYIILYNIKKIVFEYISRSRLYLKLALTNHTYCISCRLNFMYDLHFSTKKIIYFMYTQYLYVKNRSSIYPCFKFQKGKEKRHLMIKSRFIPTEHEFIIIHEI